MKHDANLLLAPERDDFLAYFSDSEKIAVPQFFLGAVRKAYPERRTAQAIVYAVKAHLYGQLAAWDEGSTARRNLRVLAVMDTEPEITLSYADWCCRYQAAPDWQREAWKREKGAGYARDVMENRPPSVRQLDYLMALGYTGPEPGTMLAAHDLIDVLKTRHVQEHDNGPERN
jgi:hypothetical protein